MGKGTVDSDFAADLKRELMKAFEDETFSYMEGNEEWEKLKEDVQV